MSDALRGSPLCKLLSAHQRPHRVFELTEGRHKGVAFAVRWISADERATALQEAHGYLLSKSWDRTDLYDGAGGSAFSLETQIRMLLRGLCNPQNPDEPMAASADELRKLLDPDEIARLYSEWATFQDERSPWRRWPTAEAFEADVDALGKGLMPPMWLSSCEHASLQRIITSLVARRQTPTKDNSSDT